MGRGAGERRLGEALGEVKEVVVTSAPEMVQERSEELGRDEGGAVISCTGNTSPSLIESLPSCS